MHSAVNVFSGSGGWCLAGRELGVESIGLEIDRSSYATRQFADLITHQVDVCDVDPLDPRWASAVGLIASPPCTSFSIGGKGAGRAHIGHIQRLISACQFPLHGVDDNTKLVVEPMRWIIARYLAENPYRWICFEQVPTVLPVWEAYAEALRGLGYSAVAGLLRAEDFGTPQTRTRAVLIATLEGPATLPMPELHTPRGFAGALGLEGDWSLVSNYESQSHRGERGVRHSPAPAWTLTGRCTRMYLVPGHIPRVRSTRGLPGSSLTVAQAGLLQDFPRDYPWYGRKDEQSLQIGNAIPVNLARAVLSRVLDPIPTVLAQSSCADPAS